MTFVTGSLVYSTAGHDKGNLFVIIKEDDEYVYLVDGKNRTIEKPKKKKRKHVRPVVGVGYPSREIMKENRIAADEEIKYFIKCFKRENQ